MKKLLLLSLLFSTALNLTAQNVGVGTTSPTNQLHIVPANAASNPLRIENLKLSNNSYDALLVTDINGVIRYIPSSVILGDSIFIKGLVDSLTINQTFKDSIFSFINDTSFIRSLDTLLLSDSIFIVGIRDSLLNDTTFINYINSLDDQNLTLGAGTATTSIPDIENGNDIIISSGAGIQLTESGNTLTIASTATGTDDQNLTVRAGTATTSILDIENGSDVTIIAGTNMTISETSSSITLNATGDGTGTDDQNLTVGAGTASTSILDIENGSDVTIIAGTNMTISETSSSITLNATGDGTGTDDQNLTLGAGTATTSILDIENGSDITIASGAGIQLAESGNTLTISSNDWHLTGNSGTTPASNFVGTTDAQPLVFRTNNTNQMRIETNGSITTFGGTSSVYIRADNTAPVAGWDNVAIGSKALGANSSGRENVAIGTDALEISTSASENVAVGEDAMHKCTNCQQNTAVGRDALWNINSGSQNTVIGSGAGHSVTSGDGNIILGTAAGPFNGTEDYTVLLGWGASANVSRYARIGNSLTTSIGGHQNWTNISDGRFKNNVKNNVPGLDLILNLRPVTYTLDHGKIIKFQKQEEFYQDEKNQQAIIDADKVIQTGFIAQEVEEAADKLGYDFSGVHKPANEGDHYGLKYAEFVVPMVKAMQEQQEMIKELQQEVKNLKEQLAK